jgi:HPt (histidine-containing phosphotransfer) domain-containing protein
MTLEQQIAALASEYRLSLGGDAASVHCLLQSINASQHPGVTTLQAIAHRVAGSAANFGLTNLAQIAGSLDGHIRDNVPLMSWFPIAERFNIALNDALLVEAA